MIAWRAGDLETHEINRMREIHALTDIDNRKLIATCKECGPTGIILRKSGKYPEGRAICVIRHKISQRDANFKKLYGVSIQVKFDMYAQQNGRCKICDTPVAFNEAKFDHDHQTNKVRGILCHPCNMGLGWFRDSKENLKSAIEYLGE